MHGLYGRFTDSFYCKQSMPSFGGGRGRTIVAAVWICVGIGSCAPVGLPIPVTDFSYPRNDGICVGTGKAQGMLQILTQASVALCLRNDCDCGMMPNEGSAKVA